MRDPVQTRLNRLILDQLDTYNKSLPLYNKTYPIYGEIWQEHDIKTLLYFMEIIHEQPDKILNLFEWRRGIFYSKIYRAELIAKRGCARFYLTPKFWSEYSSYCEGRGFWGSVKQT